jgi:hypothetical protein
MIDFSEKIKCACGCGEVINRWHQKTYPNGKKNGIRERKTVNGHGRKNQETAIEHIEKISKAQRNVPRPYVSEALKGRVFPHMVGENCNWYIDGRTPKNRLLRVSKKTQHWRNEIFQLFGYTCQMCGTKSGNGYKVILNAHHIYPWSKYPTKRWDIDNGICLCESCHNDTKGNEEAWIPFFVSIWNGVNSGKPQTDDAVGNPEPSLDGNVFEGATTNNRGYGLYDYAGNVDKSTLAETHDIV